MYSHNSHATRRRDDLIAAHTTLARRIALSIVRRVPRWIDADDLISAALVGLAEAATRFDPARQGDFETFASSRVRGAVLDELRRGDTLSRRNRVEARRLATLVRSLEHTLGRGPDDHELAAAAGLEVEECRALRAGALGRAVEMTEAGVQPATETLSPSAAVERAELLGRVQESLGGLHPRDAQIIDLYYGQQKSYLEIGQLLGISESRVCQLHARALVHVRTAVTGSAETEAPRAPRRPRRPRRSPETSVSAAALR